MIRREAAEYGPAALFLLAVIPLVIGGWVFASWQESRSYNRLTGAETTTWDAMWVDLRVQESPR